MIRISDPAALFQSVSDVSRLRLLRLLCRDELNVQELERVTGLSQPRVSKHLAVLREQGWLDQRREGTWSWYRAVEPTDFVPGEAMFRQVVAAADAVAEAEGDNRALGVVLADRRARDRDFFSGLADRWDEIRGEYEHPDIRLGALGALVDDGLKVLDIGTGTGAMLPVFAAAVGQVVAVDNSGAMLARARSLCAAEQLHNVSFCNADLVDLPFDDATFDACHCAMALHHVERPAVAVAEMVRVLRPGGRLLVSAFRPHEQTWMREELAHHRLGFTSAEIDGLFRQAGVETAGHLVRGKQTGPEDDHRRGPDGKPLVWPEVFLAIGVKARSG